MDRYVVILIVALGAGFLGYLTYQNVKEPQEPEKEQISQISQEVVSTAAQQTTEPSAPQEPTTPAEPVQTNEPESVQPSLVLDGVCRSTYAITPIIEPICVDFKTNCADILKQEKNPPDDAGFVEQFNGCKCVLEQCEAQGF